MAWDCKIATASGVSASSIVGWVLKKGATEVADFALPIAPESELEKATLERGKVAGEENANVEVAAFGKGVDIFLDLKFRLQKGFYFGSMRGERFGIGGIEVDLKLVGLGDVEAQARSGEGVEVFNPVFLVRRIRHFLSPREIRFRGWRKGGRRSMRDPTKAKGSRERLGLPGMGGIRMGWPEGTSIRRESGPLPKQ